MVFALTKMKIHEKNSQKDQLKMNLTKAIEAYDNNETLLTDIYMTLNTIIEADYSITHEKGVRLKNKWLVYPDEAILEKEDKQELVLLKEYQVRGIARTINLANTKKVSNYIDNLFYWQNIDQNTKFIANIAFFT